MKNLNILTLNTQKAYQSSFGDFIHDVLVSDKYDFVLLQEVDAKVVSIITQFEHSYIVVRPFDVNLSTNTGVCILYKKAFVLKDTLFISFANFDPNMPMRGWGFVGGIFAVQGQGVLVGSVHLHSGIKTSIRKKEIEIIKESLSNYKNNIPIVFAGDFNTGFPGEVSEIEKILLPDFIRVSKNIGPTLDSRYTEKSSFLLNRVNSFFARFGISFKFRTDHVYFDISTLKTNDILCTVLPNRVSDHLAIDIKTHSK